MSEIDFTKPGGEEPRDDTPEATEATAQVRVTAFGADPIPVDFVEGKKVRYYLDQAGVTVGFRKRISLNGESAGKNTAVTEGGSTIVVANNVGNG